MLSKSRQRPPPPDHATCAPVEKTASLALTPRQCRAFYAALAAANPQPTTELHYSSHFELLVAVVLSAQSTDIGVNRATARLFPLAHTPAAMLALGQERIEQTIRTLGLYRNKTRHLLGLSRALLDRHQGKVPHTREALEALPGVGRKTANVMLNTAFGEATIAVDTHLFRVANRTGLAPGRTVRAVEDQLLRITPAEYRQGAHHWLILHGRYTCTARKPRCGQCPVARWCRYPDKTVG